MLSLRRNMRRLIVLGEVLSNLRCTEYATTTTTSRKLKNSHAFPTIFNSLHFSGGGYTECKNYHAEAETIGGSNTFVRSIRKGDTICLNRLLFTHNRDYLVKNNGQHVKAEQLEGKVVGIYFLPLSAHSRQHSLWHTALSKEIYDDLHPDNYFEIVLVACNIFDPDFTEEKPVHLSLQTNSQKFFRDLFSYMPWTAIPFSDVTSRKHMQTSFGVPEGFSFQPMMYIVDPTGMVLQCSSWDIFEYYGSLGHPFSDKRLKFLRTEDYLATQQPSLKTLLGSPQRDYVLSNDGDKVPIHTFEHKVVGLYFYHPDCPDPDLATEELKLAYEEFAKIKNLFEVVLVYIREPRSTFYFTEEKSYWKCEESFWETFKTMPWLALPFKNMNYKKLMRVFEFQSHTARHLVMFGPHAGYIEPFGLRLQHEYGVGGFPFTRKKAAELENEKIKELKLEMLWDPNTVFRRKDGSQVPLSQLFGKRVMLVLESFNKSLDVYEPNQVKSTTEFLTKLKERYLQKKGTDDEFEVIRILANNTESSISKDLV